MSLQNLKKKLYIIIIYLYNFIFQFKSKNIILLIKMANK